MALFVKNWEKFQHFKDRKPPWIKLYRDILDDIKWHELDPNSAKTLISLWLLASESDKKNGELPTIKEIAFRLRMTERSLKSDISKLNHWLRQDDINMISDINAISTRYQDDGLETETETETDSMSGKPDTLNGFNWTDQSTWPFILASGDMSDEHNHFNVDIFKYILGNTTPELQSRDSEICNKIFEKKDKKGKIKIHFIVRLILRFFLKV